MAAREDLIALGHAIRHLRQARHLTIEALAFKAGVSSAHLGKIERGHGNPRLGTLFALAGALGVTNSQLAHAAEVGVEASGESRPTNGEFDRHSGHLPTDGEG